MYMSGYSIASQYQASLSPPAGSPWATVLDAWDAAGQPYSSPFNIPALNLYGYTASVKAMENLGSGDSAKVNAGDLLTQHGENGYTGQVALDSIFYIDATQSNEIILAPNAAGQLVQTINTRLLNGFSKTVIAIMAVATAAIGGAAIAGAGAVGGTGTVATGEGAGLSSTDVSTIYGDAGYGSITPDVPIVTDAPVIPDVPAVPDAPPVPDAPTAAPEPAATPDPGTDPYANETNKFIDQVNSINNGTDMLPTDAPTLDLNAPPQSSLFDQALSQAQSKVTSTAINKLIGAAIAAVAGSGAHQTTSTNPATGQRVVTTYDANGNVVSSVPVPTSTNTLSEFLSTPTGLMVAALGLILIARR